MTGARGLGGHRDPYGRRRRHPLFDDPQPISICIYRSAEANRDGQTMSAKPRTPTLHPIIILPPRQKWRLVRPSRLQ